MTIKAVLRDGQIQPVEPLPGNWTDGQELIVEEPETVATEALLKEWSADLEAAAVKLPASEHDSFRGALSEIEHQSKDAIRREWGLS